MCVEVGEQGGALSQWAALGPVPTRPPHTRRADPPASAPHNVPPPLALSIRSPGPLPRPTLQADTEFLAGREKKLTEWREWLDGRREAAEARDRFAREQLGERYAAHEQYSLQEAEVSVVLDSKEEPYKGP